MGTGIFLLSSLFCGKLTILIFFRKMFFSIGRNCLREAKLEEYVVHIIDDPPKKKKFKGGLFEKIHFQNFQKNHRHFLNFRILTFFSDHSIELKIPHHIKGKPTEYVYLVKNCIILENISAVFMKL